MVGESDDRLTVYTRAAMESGAVPAETRAPAAEVRSAPVERGVPAYAAEFIGTFLLVFFICMVGVGRLQGRAPACTDFAVIGLVHFLLLAMLVYTLGGTSGAHFNPAVTTALAALRKIRRSTPPIYILLQLAGAVAGALLCKALLLDEGKGANYGATP